MESRNGCGLLALFLAVLMAGGALIGGFAGTARAATTGTVPPDAAAPASAQGTRYRAEINPVLELLAGVQSQTDWVTESRGPRGEGTEYYRALKAFFAPYKEHPAMQISAKLLKADFAFDAPVGFVCHLGPLPDLELKHEYSDYLIGRAGGREKLEEFRLALKDLAAKSNFADFLKQWQPSYDKWLAAVAFDGDKVVNWLNEFSGVAPGEYHMLLAPAMFPGGGYGATVTAEDGTKIIYQIVRDQSQASDKEPVFPNGESLERLALHEWGHSFVNPAVENNPASAAVMRRFYLRVAGTMRKYAYGTVATYSNEQFLRAVTSLAIGELYGEDKAQAAVAREQERGFRLTGAIYESLKDYRANRAQYPTFESYLPVVFDKLKHESAGPLLPVWALVGLGVVGGAVLLVVFTRRRPAEPAN